MGRTAKIVAHAWAPWVTLALSAVVTFHAWSLSHRAVTRQIDEELERRVTEVSDAVQRRMGDVATVLRGVGGLFVGSDVVEAAELRTAIGALGMQRTLPGVQGIAFARHEVDAGGAVHVRTALIAPDDARNRRALAVELWAEPTRREALERARDSGEPALTAGLRLVQEIDGDVQRGVVLYYPVYAKGAATTTVDERRRALIGYVYSPLRARDALRAVLGSRGDVAAALYDGPAIAAEQLLADDIPRDAVGARALTRELSIAGRVWTLRVAALRGFAPAVSETQPIVVLVGGGLIDLLLFGMVASFARVRRRAAALAAEMTHELRAVNHDLASARDVAEQATRARADFLARMSHELRTPLNGFIGMTELALDTALTLEQRDYLETARASAENMLALIGDVLDFSKIDAGKLALERAPFGLRAALGDVVRGLAQRAHAKGLELVLHVDAATPDAYFGDVVRLRQIVTNLVGNAVKFTVAGGVVVRVGGDAEGALTIAVRDTGIGIAPEIHARIFRAFEQGGPGAAQRLGGTGLGLAISRQLAELMGGGVSVDSAPGCGAELRVTLRLEVDRAAAAPALPPAALRGQRVLLVDDHAGARAAAAALLHELGMSVAATDEAGALAACAAPATFDVLLVDSHIPGVDLPRLAAQLLLAQPAARLVLMTLLGRPSDVTWAGLDERARVAKPLLAPALVAALTAAPKGPAADAAAPPAPRALRLLVAEDNVVNRKLVVTLLTKAGHSVVAVEDGRRALEAVLASRFDAALLDVEMPELTGLEVARELRAEERLHGGRLPLIALTAQALAGDHERCLAAGIDLYVTKPIAPEVLFAALVTATDRAARLPFDRRRALATLDGDVALLAEILADYREMAPEVQRALELAVQRRDACGVAEHAHRLKGVLLSMAAESASAAAHRLEEQGRSGRLDGVEAAAAALRAELAVLDEAVEAELGRVAAA